MNYNAIQTDSDDAFVEKSVALLTEHIQASIHDHGQCTLGLSGGSTPKAIYTALGAVQDIDWSKVFVFLVDERYIEADHPDSNQYLVRNTLLQGALIPEENLAFPDASLDLPSCVNRYTEDMVQLLGNRPPDVLTLGLGGDGHIASLFPPVSENAFGEQIVLHTTTDQFAVHDRISISPLMIMAAQSQVLFLKGEEKREVFEECSVAELDPARWPLHVALATGRTSVVFG